MLYERVPAYESTGIIERFQFSKAQFVPDRESDEGFYSPTVGLCLAVKAFFNLLKAVPKIDTV